MKIIKVNVGEMPFVKEIDAGLKSMQAEVGGLIEMLMPYNNDVCIVCNEEGKINGLPLNRIIFDEAGQPLDIIAGNFFICYAPADSEEFESLPDNLIPDYIDKFSR